MIFNLVGRFSPSGPCQSVVSKAVFSRSLTLWVNGLCQEYLMGQGPGFRPPFKSWCFAQCPTHSKFSIRYLLGECVKWLNSLLACLFRCSGRCVKPCQACLGLSGGDTSLPFWSLRFPETWIQLKLLMHQTGVFPMASICCLGVWGSWDTAQ